jgi:acetate---CoA ligase (ADP-forming)
MSRAARDQYAQAGARAARTRVDVEQNIGMPDHITGERLTSLFRPRSVALVGASDKSAFSQIAYHNLVRFGFAERTYLVSRRGTPTHGQPTVTSCAQIGEPVDVAYLMVPQAGLLEALDDAAAAGIRNACVLSSGYAEAGEAGRAAQDELARHAAGLGLVLLGPNHLGFANLTDGVPVCSIPGLPAEGGPVALLSQSGASSSAMTDFAAMANVGLSYLVTLGNEAMITAGHVLDYLVDDPGTRAVAVFMETVRDPETFRRAARRAAEAGKAIVVLKAGSSALSARTAAAHTGALVGDDRVIDAVFADLGIIRVDSIEDMLITAGAAAALGRLGRTGIGIVSISGGACDIVADRADDLGADLPALAPATKDALAAIMPAYGTVQNPLDVTGAAIIDPTIFTRSIEAMSADPSIGVIGVVNSIPWIDTGQPYGGQMFVDAIGAGMRAASCPTAYVNQVMQPVTGYTRAAMERGGVPYVIPGLRQAVVALRNVAWWSEATRASGGLGGVVPPQGGSGGMGPPGEGASRVPDARAPAAPVPVPAPGLRRGKWSEPAARALLAEAGIPVVPARLAGSADEAVQAAAEYLGGPLSVKIVSADILHKSDIGGVRLDVAADEGAVRAAYQAVTAAAPDGARIEGVLVSPMRRGGAELLVGVVPDPQWGPVLAVAIGGLFVEVLRDSALAPLPVTPGQAGRLLDRLRGRAVLDGVRGAAPADRDALAAVIARIGDLALALGDSLESLEVNPLLVDGDRIEALDAVVTWREHS